MDDVTCKVQKQFRKTSWRCYISWSLEEGKTTTCRVNLVCEKSKDCKLGGK